MTMKLMRFSCFVLSLFVLSACCRDCLITNRELSSLKKYKQGSDEAVNISSGWKESEIILTGNKGIVSYGIDNNNILSGIDAQYVDSSFLRDRDGEGWGLLKFTPLENGIVGKNMVIFSDCQTANRLRDVRKISMNLDNGQLTLGEEIFNEGSVSIGLRQDDSISLASGGYFLFPLSILSNLGNGRSYQPDNTMSSQTIQDAIAHHGNWLIVKAVSGVNLDLESNSGWFAYQKGNLLFIKKYNCINDHGKRENRALKIKVGNGNVAVSAQGFVREIAPGHSVKETQKWNVIEVDPIKDINSAVNFFKDKEMRIKILIER